MSKLNIQTFVVSPLMENTYVVWDASKDTAVLIDPGGGEERIVEFLKAQGLRLEKILATHGHVDHMVSVHFFQSKFDVPFWVHAGDEALIKTSETLGSMFGFGRVPVPRIDGYLAEGDRVCVGGYKFHVLETPGHSLGSCCFYCAAAGVVFVGDVLFREGVGRTDLPDGSFEELRTAILEKLYVLPDETVVYCGHGVTTTIGYEKRNNPFVRING